MAETAMQGCAGEMLEEVSLFASFPMLIRFILLDATFILLSFVGVGGVVLLSVV